MDMLLTEGEWIDRFVAELARLGAAMDAEVLIDLGREVWPFLGELRPEDAACANWDLVPC